MNTKYTQSAVESILPSVIVRCAPKNIKQETLLPQTVRTTQRIMSVNILSTV